MARIDPIAPASMSPELRALLATRPPYRIYSVLANAPTALPGFIQLASALLTQSELDSQLREMVILRVGALCNSAYEMHQHVRLARHVGVSEERIRKAMTIDAASEGESLEDKLLAFTDSVVRLVKAPKEQFDAVRAELSPRGVTELLMTIGTYMMVSRVLENREVEIERAPLILGRATITQGNRRHSLQNAAGTPHFNRLPDRPIRTRSWGHLLQAEMEGLSCTGEGLRRRRKHRYCSWPG